LLSKRPRDGGADRPPPKTCVRVRAWRRSESDYPSLHDVACRLSLAHATSAASERNWSVWGDVFTSARTKLGLERSKALIAICANDRANKNVSADFEVALDVVEGLLD
jgi:hypothetical protein